MPAFSPMGEYRLTSTQVDLIIYALNNTQGMCREEDNERRKILEEFQSTRYFSNPLPKPPPYDNLCDI